MSKPIENMSIPEIRKLVETNESKEDTIELLIKEIENMRNKYEYLQQWTNDYERSLRVCIDTDFE